MYTGWFAIHTLNLFTSSYLWRDFSRIARILVLRNARLRYWRIFRTLRTKALPSQTPLGTFLTLGRLYFFIGFGQAYFTDYLLGFFPILRPQVFLPILLFEFFGKGTVYGFGGEEFTHSCLVKVFGVIHGILSLKAFGL